MSDTPTILWLIVGFIITIIIIFIIAIIVDRIITKSNTGGNVVIPSECGIATNAVPNISNLNCCKIGGNITPFRFMGVVDNVIYDMVVAPEPVPWRDVCIGFCPNGVNVGTNNCSDGNGGIDEQATANFNRCESQLKPTNPNCLGNPIASVGTTLYYGHAATDSECPIMNRVSCNN